MATGWRSRTVFGEKGTAEMGVTGHGMAVMYKKNGGVVRSRRWVGALPLEPRACESPA